jgi:predicted CXXCH cytochrome family protein
MINFNQVFTHFIRTTCVISLCVFSISCFASPDFVGSKQCIDCHTNQYSAWQGSHHDMAMRHAKPDSVKGDFNDITFYLDPIVKEKYVRFYKKGNEYWIELEEVNEQRKAYQIKYTFGVEPLQQYMVEFSDGRVQLLPYAWDSRSKKDGGQRWFNLYPDQTEAHQEFFWKNTGQNWNYMCADCHSTNVKKNFDVTTNSYKTTYSEINVGCESCHGPASDHIAWSLDKKPHTNKGFERNIKAQVDNWLLNPGARTVSPEKITPTQQTLVCAQCHSRHVQISNNDHVKSNAFGERYLLNLIDSQRYFHDGQVYDEDYVYGSFLQSKMNEQGVVCSNCHNPHTAKLKIQPEQVCLQCHQAEAYATEQHHHHSDNSEGAQCVNCHMPETTYMQIDKRRDHRWHIPRPDFAKRLGVPDTCLSCHDDKDSNWSSDIVRSWYPNLQTISEADFAPVFAAADQGYSGISSALSHIAQNNSNADIIRASALERMDRFIDTNTIIAIARNVKSDNEHIRIGAIRGSEGIVGLERFRVLSELLEDPVLAVRTEAARALMPLWKQLNQAQKKRLEPPLTEYMDIQNFNADRGFAHTNKGNVYRHQGLLAEAIKAYETSIRIEPYFSNAYINLADLYRAQQKNKLVFSTLKQGILANPSNGYLPYSLGLAYIRNKQKDLGLKYLKQAAITEPDNAQFQYAYGLSVETENLSEATKALNKAYRVGGNPEHLYALCEIQVRYKSFHAKKCLDELRQVAPANAVAALEKQLKKP